MPTSGTQYNCAQLSEFILTPEPFCAVINMFSATLVVAFPPENSQSPKLKEDNEFIVTLPVPSVPVLVIDTPFPAIIEYTPVWFTIVVCTV